MIVRYILLNRAITKLSESHMSINKKYYINANKKIYIKKLLTHLKLLNKFFRNNLLIKFKLQLEKLNGQKAKDWKKDGD
jgi:hypothetical protein